MIAQVTFEEVVKAISKITVEETRWWNEHLKDGKYVR